MHAMLGSSMPWWCAEMQPCKTMPDHQLCNDYEGSWHAAQLSMRCRACACRMRHEPSLPAAPRVSVPGCSVDWEQERTLSSNYAANKLVLDPNEGFGRNQASLPLKSKEEREAAGEEVYDDDDGEPSQTYSPALAAGSWYTQHAAGLQRVACTRQAGTGHAKLLSACCHLSEHDMGCVHHLVAVMGVQQPLAGHHLCNHHAHTCRAARCVQPGAQRGQGAAPAPDLHAAHRHRAPHRAARGGRGRGCTRLLPVLLVCDGTPLRWRCLHMHNLPSVHDCCMLCGAARPVAHPLPAVHVPAHPQAMVLDTKHNKWQHSAGQLKKLIHAHTFWSAKGPAEAIKHDFRGPQKPYKRL